MRPAGVAAAAAAIAVAEGGAFVGATVAPATEDALTRDAAWERIALVCSSNSHHVPWDIHLSKRRGPVHAILRSMSDELLHRAASRSSLSMRECMQDCSRVRAPKQVLATGSTSLRLVFGSRPRPMRTCNVYANAHNDNMNVHQFVLVRIRALSPGSVLMG